MRVLVVEPEKADPLVGDALRRALRAAGFDVLPDAPAHHVGLATSERERFLAVVDRLHEADLLVADVSAPSHAVGWCVAWFLARGRLVVLCCPRDQRALLSPMLVGNPSPWQRIAFFETAADVGDALRKALGS